MRHGLIRLLAVVIVAAVSGCGGSGTAVPTSAAPTQAPAAESSAASNGGTDSGTEPTAEASVAAVASAAPAGGGGGGGAAVGICELVTPDELAAIFGVASVKTTVIPGPPDNCIVESDAGDGLSAWSLMTAQAATVYSAMTTDPSTVAVPGIGDQAAIVQNTGILVLKGNSLLSVALTAAPDMSEEQVLDAAKQIASLAAGRL